MAGNLDIRVVVEGNQTVSKFAVFSDGHVTFHNDASAQLTVAFSDPNQFCKGNTPKPSIFVDPGKKETLKVCDGATATTLKYTATVENAMPEDPIIIFERREKNPINIFESLDPVSLAGGLVLGLVVGYLIGRKLMTRSGPQR